jgi:hypothetical protein
MCVGAKGPQFGYTDQHAWLTSTPTSPLHFEGYVVSDAGGLVLSHGNVSVTIARNAITKM